MLVRAIICHDNSQIGWRPGSPQLGRSGSEATYWSTGSTLAWLPTLRLGACSGLAKAVLLESVACQRHVVDALMLSLPIDMLGSGFAVG